MNLSQDRKNENEEDARQYVYRDWLQSGRISLANAHLRSTINITPGLA